MTPSPAYMQALEEARAHHLSSKTYSGKFLRPHAPLIKALIDHYGIKRILDYGCGKGSQYEWVSHGGEDASIPEGMTLESYWDVEVYKFDPAWPPLAESPDPRYQFGMTIITHVLGSIPLGDLHGWVLPSIAAATENVVYMAEKIGPVQKRVFRDTSDLPRWDALTWHRFACRVSERYPELLFVMATNERTDDGKISQVTHWKQGEQLR